MGCLILKPSTTSRRFDVGLALCVVLLIAACAHASPPTEVPATMPTHKTEKGFVNPNTTAEHGSLGGFLKANYSVVAVFILKAVCHLMAIGYIFLILDDPLHKATVSVCEQSERLMTFSPS